VVQDQFGLKAQEVGELDHWFSIRSRDGNCNELLDVYVAMVDGVFSPSSNQPKHDQIVDWVHFADLLGEGISMKKSKWTLFHMEDGYRASMLRRLRPLQVPAEVRQFFGDRSAATISPAAGAAFRIAQKYRKYIDGLDGNRRLAVR
jgi:hypothetical protein